ncbi:hypothetical protein ACK8GE_21420 [Micromonosporaceae bacterium DT194]|uniref:hypothetical protein n=1 Tax=Melissospora conviva TaxID=3388432 RepID=UPI003C27FFB2
MRILGLDIWIPLESVDYETFTEDLSIFEYDAVIWDPVNTYDSIANARYRHYFNGYPKLGEAESVKFFGDLTRRKKEFKEFLEMGRTLVVLASAPLYLQVDTGERRHSGTGKNRHTTYVYRAVDMLSAVPAEVKSQTGRGSAIEPKREDFAACLRGHREFWQYRAILEEFPGKPLAVVAGTNKPVGSIATYTGGGVFVQLPDLVNSDSSSTDDDGDDELEDGADDSTGSRNEPDAQEEAAYASLIAWVTTLRAASTQDLPEWAEKLYFPEDVELEGKLSDIEKQLQELRSTAAELRAEKAKNDRWKDLITATGDPLEDRAVEAFEILGFETLERIPGRTDIRIKTGDDLAVVEVKGVTKSASEAHAAQLEKWVSDALIEHKQKHKGILLVNAWRKVPIKERDAASFPDQMRPYCVSREHCLLTGMQLLSLVRAVQAGKMDPADARRLLLTTSGPLPDWDRADEVFPESPAAEPA